MINWLRYDIRWMQVFIYTDLMSAINWHSIFFTCNIFK